MFTVWLCVFNTFSCCHSSVRQGNFSRREGKRIDPLIFFSFLSAPLHRSLVICRSIFISRPSWQFNWFTSPISCFLGVGARRATAEVDSFNWMSYREMIFFCLMRPCSYGVDCRRAVFVAMALFVSFLPKTLHFHSPSNVSLVAKQPGHPSFAFCFIFISFLSGEFKVSFFFVFSPPFQVVYIQFCLFCFFVFFLFNFGSATSATLSGSCHGRVHHVIDDSMFQVWIRLVEKEREMDRDVFPLFLRMRVSWVEREFGRLDRRHYFLQLILHVP